MIYVEKSALHLPLTQAAAKINTEMRVIEDGEQVADIKTNIVITAKHDNFVHPCPGTNIYRCCNYYVADIMQGCPFDCAYCILQAYLPHKHIRVSGDMDEVARAVMASDAVSKRRIGTGELADSLALDHIIPLSTFIIPLANANDNIRFEFKTKSAQIKNLLNMNPKNVMVSWSLNPSEIIEREEPLTAPLRRRLDAMKTVTAYGYKVGFHFDPLILTDDFEQIYGTLIDELIASAPENMVEFISVSTFRCPPELLDIIRLRQADSILTKGDFVHGLDGKIRYFKALRLKMIKFVVERLRKEWKKPFIYLCMEHESVWKNICGYDPADRESFERLFPFN